MNKGDEDAHAPSDSRDLIAAHRHSSTHGNEMARSVICGCFSCLATYEPSAIRQWEAEDDHEEGHDPNRVSAFCPECGIDAVIGDASGYPVSDRDFLSRMNAHWFTPVVNL